MIKNEEGATQLLRRPYTSPVLTIYGTVGELTLASRRVGRKIDRSFPATPKYLGRDILGS